MTAPSLGTLITYNPWTATPGISLHDVAVCFRSLGVHHAPVVNDERRVVGMVSETDLLRARQLQRTVLVPAGAEVEHTTPYFVRDVMSDNVVTIGPNSSFSHALNLLLLHKIHAIPVVEAGRLLGMITSRDFIREFSYGEISGSREPVAARLKPTVDSVDPDTTLEQALLTMHEAGVSCLAVAADGCPLGVLSQRDIVRARCRLDDEAGSEDSAPATVMQVARDSPAIRPGQLLCQAAAAMIEQELPAITVVNQANRLMGLITEDELLQVMYDGSK